jgi:hypothetical protein
MKSYFRAPEPDDAHYKYWVQIKAGGRVWCNDRLNNKQRWLDLEYLGGDANKIQRYGYNDLSIVRYVVMDEHTLGYLDNSTPMYVHVLHGSVLKGGHDWKNGPAIISPGHTILRPATTNDFAEYRVSIPPDFK